MPRNKIERPIHPAPVLNEEAIREDMETAATLNGLKEAYAPGRDYLNQVIGHVQMGRAVSKFLDVMGFEQLRKIKETKSYRALAGQKGVDFDGDEIPDVGVWDGFCRAIGSSSAKIDEDLKNIAMFGEEALKNLSVIGYGYRELRQFRKLPADDRLALIEAAKSGDKAELVDVAELMISKHLKESEKLTQERDEAKKTADAREQVIASKEKVISRLQEQIAWKPAPEFAAEKIFHELDAEALGCAARIETSLRAAMLAVNDADATPALAAQALAAAVGRVLAAARQLADDYGIAVTGPNATQEARDEAAEDAAIWAAVHEEMAGSATKHEPLN